jgi:hypothetical protein
VVKRAGNLTQTGAALNAASSARKTGNFRCRGVAGRGKI